MMMDLMDLITRAVDLTTQLDPIDALRAFFVFAACTTLTISFPASFRSRFVTYGPRAASPADSKSQPEQSRSIVIRVLDSLVSLRVPHSYFTHFYIASVLSSLFWGFQLLSRGNVFQVIASRIHPEHLESSMSVNQVMVSWMLLIVQGSRRLYECLAFSKPSSSKMWFVHWLLGIAFYLAAAVAIWVEGTGTILSHDLTLDDIKLTNPPSLRTFICVPMFLVASGVQHDCHHYLFSLEKYTLPTHPVFTRVVSPHYTAECAIYLSLALLAAPKGELVNKTLLSALCFVAVNLGVTAGTSRQWYRTKFGNDAVRGKWNMIPWVY